MKIKIHPQTAKGIIYAPPSKSMAHRMLMGAGLSDGTSVVHNIELSEDVKSTLEILGALGASYKIEDTSVTITGIGNQTIASDKQLNCRESGSTLRFFVPLLLTGGMESRFVGAKRLFERPLGIYEDICEKQGIVFEKEETGLYVKGQLKAGEYDVPGDISSQFITGLLFALPLLDKDSTLRILPPVESRAYIELTLETLEYFGIKIDRKGDVYHIPGRQHYHAKDAQVEGDYSNAAFLDALGLLGGDVCVTGLGENSSQGDRVYRTYYKKLLEGYQTLDIAECPDLGPILMGVAAALHGARFTGTRRLRIKESDRAAVMAEELAKFGIEVIVGENEVEVRPGTLRRPAVPTDSHNDHRIAMTMTVLLTLTGGELAGAEAVKKSYPGFFRDINRLGIIVQEEEES